MFRIYQRYIAASFIPPFLLALLFFVTFLLTSQLFRITKTLINKDVSLETTLFLIGHIAISFLPFALPLAIFFAIIYTLNKLSEDFEIVAMGSLGMKKNQLLAPLFIMGVAIALTIFSLGTRTIPHSKTQFKNTIVKLSSRGMLNDIRAEYFFTEIPNITFFVEKAKEGGKEMEDVFIHFMDKKKGEERLIFAKRGILTKSEDSGQTLLLHLFDGNITTTSKKTGDVEKVLFAEYDFPILKSYLRLTFITKDSMRTTRELAKIIEEKKKELALLKLKSGGRGDKKQIKELKYRLIRSQLEFWARWNTPLQCLLFIFLGFSLGIKKQKGRHRREEALALLVLVTYYALFFTGVALSRKAFLSPALVIFLPTLIGGVIGWRHYQKLDWPS